MGLCLFSNAHQCTDSYENVPKKKIRKRKNNKKLKEEPFEIKKEQPWDENIDYEAEIPWLPLPKDLRGTYFASPGCRSRICSHPKISPSIL